MVISGLTEEQLWEDIFTEEVKNLNFKSDLPEKQFIKIRIRLNEFSGLSKLTNGGHAFGIVYVQFTASGY